MKNYILLSLFISLAFALNAQSTYTFVGGGANTNWGHAANWTCSGTCPNGSGLVVPILLAGDAVIIASACNVNNNRTIPAGVTMTINNGITVTIAGSLNIDGTLTNEGDIINNGTFRNRNSTTNNGTVTNNGTMIITANGSFNNYGTLDNNSSLENRNDFYNAGTFNNNAGGTFTNGNNASDLFDNDGIVNNNGSIVNNAQITSDLPFPTSGSGSFTGSGSLPITLSTFTYEQIENTIRLKWVTESEKNNAYIDVERSKDGIHFVKIGQRKGFGTTNEPKQYEWTDLSPMPGINYYRLKQVDYDGKFEYHKVIAVEFNGKSAQTGIRLYPTEVKDQVQVIVDQPLTNESILYVSDMTGRIVQRQKIAAGTVQQELQLHTLPAGLYLISLQSNKTVQTARFIKL